MAYRKKCLPNPLNKEILFKSLFNYWATYLLNKTFPLVRDNRFNSHLVTIIDYNGFSRKEGCSSQQKGCSSKKEGFASKKEDGIMIKYNLILLREWPLSMILSGIFHEIGHILQGNSPYTTYNDKLISEFDAEKFAVRMMRKFYSKELKEVILFTKKVLKSKDYQHSFPIHFEAFRKIKEYQ